MAKVFEKTPCEHCPFEALSQTALEGHMDRTHPDWRGEGGIAVPDEPPADVPRAEAAEPEPPTPPQAQPARQVHPALKVPQGDPTFWVGDRTVRLLHAVGRMSGAGEVVNVLLIGPKGTGKSSLPKEFAAAQGRPFFEQHCQLVAERDDWWGSKELSLDKGTHVERAAFLDAVETEGCVVMLDEANRTHPENLNALFGLLDHRRSAWVPLLKKTVTVARGVVFFVTLNEGYEYVGTQPLDEALRDRMTYAIPMGYVPKRREVAILVKRTGLAEDVADKLAEFARTVRRDVKLQAAISTRQLLGAAGLVNEGMALPDAVVYAVVNPMGADVDRKAMLQALQMLGKLDDAYAEGGEDDDD